MKALTIVVVILCFVVVGLAFMEWKDLKRLQTIDTALTEVADEAVRRFEKSIQDYTDEQIKEMEKTVKQQASALGISIDSIQDVKKIATATESQMETTLDQLKSTVASYEATVNQEAERVLQQFNTDLANGLDSSNTELLEFIESLKQIYRDQETAAIDSSAKRMEKINTDIDGHMTQRQEDIDTKIQTIIEEMQETHDSNQKQLSDLEEELFIDARNQFERDVAREAEAKLEDLSRRSQEQIKAFDGDLIAYYDERRPIFLSQLQQALQTVIDSNKNQLQAVMYQYGYRREITGISIKVGRIDSSNNGQSLAASMFTGLSSVVKSVGESIVLYTCTLPEDVPFEYDAIAQIYSAKLSPNTFDNDISVIIRPVSESRFVVAAENLTGASNDNVVSVTLVEK